MEFDATALTSGATLALVFISLLGLTIRMNRLFADLSAKVGALDAKVEALAADVAENRSQIQRVRAEMNEEFGRVRAEMNEGFRLVREEMGQRRSETTEEFRLLRSENSKESRLIRTESRESLAVVERKIERLGDKIDANAAAHDANLKEVGRHVVGLNARVSRVEGYIEAVTRGEWPVASGQ
ncbi:MAG: hypothetical protein OXS29_14020 [bacterium]|nr:hypothetical protein [bacterium]MDE0287267.1 hypothetical protein [bacterium]MDE0438992.1 hypothetical protein [bacterium]